MGWQDDPIVDAGGGGVATAPAPDLVGNQQVAPDFQQASHWTNDPVVGRVQDFQNAGGEPSNVSVSPGSNIGPDYNFALSPKYPTGQTGGGFIKGYSEPVPPMTPEQTQSNALEGQADAIRQGAARQLRDWFDQRQGLIDPLAAGDQSAIQQFNQMNQQQPFPAENLRMIDQGNAQQAAQQYQEQFKYPAQVGSGKIAPDSNILNNLSATWKGDIPAFGEALAAKGVGAVGDVVGRMGLTTQVSNYANYLQKSSDERRQTAQDIRTGQPQTGVGQFVTSQADLGIAALPTILTKDPALASAAFTGIFSTEAAARAWAQAKNQEQPDNVAFQDAAFSGLKAALISRLPTAWPALAKETAAVQMAGAYLSGSAITTGDAVADQAWRSLVRGEKLDDNAVARIGMAFLQGGPTFAGMHGLHAAAGAIGEQIGQPPETPLRTAEPPLTGDLMSLKRPLDTMGRDSLQADAGDLQGLQEPTAPDTTQTGKTQGASSGEDVLPLQTHTGGENGQEMAGVAQDAAPVAQAQTGQAAAEDAQPAAGGVAGGPVEGERFTPQEVIDAGVPPEVVRRLIENQGSPWKDVTPNGYGPSAMTGDEPSAPALDIGSWPIELQRLRNSINEQKTLLNGGKLSPEQRTQIEASVGRAEAKLREGLATSRFPELRQQATLLDEHNRAAAALKWDRDHPPLTPAQMSKASERAYSTETKDATLEGQQPTNPEDQRAGVDQGEAPQGPGVGDRVQAPGEVPPQRAGGGENGGVTVEPLTPTSAFGFIKQPFDKHSVFGGDGMGLRYNKGKGGWIVPPGKMAAAKEITGKLPPPMEKQKTPIEQRRTVKERRDVEQRLLDWHRQSPDFQAGVEQQYADEQATGETAGAEGVFRGKIPDEVKRLLSPEEFRRAKDTGILRVAEGKEHTGGADALGQLGDDAYARLIRRQLDANQGRGAAVEAAKESARSSDDPSAQFMAAVHDALQTTKDVTPFEVKKPHDLGVGTKFTFQGEPFRVTEDANGIRVLRDGGTFPEVPLDWLDKVPVDKGSMKSGSAFDVPPHFMGGTLQESPTKAVYRAGDAEAGPEAGAGMLGTVRDRVRAVQHYVIDEAKRYVGKQFPAMHRASDAAGNAAARFTASRIYAKEAAPVVAREIVGTDAKGRVDPELDKLVGATLVQDNLDSIQKHFNDAGDHEAANNVGSLIGAEGSPFATRTDYARALKDPKVVEAIQRYKEWQAGEPEENFRVSQGIAADEELPSRGEITGARVNLRAVLPGEPAGKAVLTSVRGNLTNPRSKPSPFARAAKGNAPAYEISLAAMIENTLGRGTEIANQHRMYDALVQGKLATVGRGGQNVMLEGKRTIPLEVESAKRYLSTKTNEEGAKETTAFGTPAKKLYVRADVYKEVRRALAVDQPAKIPILSKALGGANVGALASAGEMMFHMGNQLAALVRTPGLGTVIPGLVKKMVALGKGDPAAQRQLVELARIGALKEHVESGGTYNPLKYGGRMIDFADRAGRLLMDDAFTKLADKGLFEDTEQNRRDFINQFGNYNARTHQALIALAKETNFGPFAVAGTNFWGLGLKNLTLSPGAKATSTAAAIALRANVLGRFVVPMAMVGVANYLRWGRMDGSANLPIGALRLADDKDGKMRYVDVGGLLGISRGLKASGLQAVGEGLRRGQGGAEIVDKASSDIWQSALSPFVGPGPRIASILATGKEFPSGFQVADTAEKGKSQFAQNVKGAAKAFNPLVDAIATGKNSQLGRFTIKTASKRDETQAEMLADRLAQDRLGGLHLAPSDKAKHDAREALVQQIRANPGEKAKILDQGVKNGTIANSDRASVVQEAGRDYLSNKVKRMELDDAMQVWERADAKERASIKTIVMQKIAAARDKKPEEKRAMFEKVRGG